jgi:hypothetical protein
MDNQSITDVIANIQQCLQQHHSFANGLTMTEFLERNFRWCIPKDLDRTLENHYYSMDNDLSEIQNAQALLQHSQQYVDIIENIIYSYFSSFKNKLVDEKRKIQRNLREKQDYIIYLRESSILHTNVERKCLGFMANMPGDVAKLVAEYALTPHLQYLLIKSECGDLTCRLNRMKLQNIKKFGRVIQSHANKLYFYLIQNIIPVWSVKKMCDISYLQRKPQFNKISNIILFIIDIMNCCDGVIDNLIRRKNLETVCNLVMLKAGYLYKSIMFVSRPEFNSRKVVKR